MANSFISNKKVKIFAAAMYDACDYTKASVSKMPQSEFEGKKYGRGYSIYLPGVPKIVNGVVADPSDIAEIETEIFIDNDNTSFEVNQLQALENEEDFRDQIAKPLAFPLARGQEKKIVAANCFKSAQAVVAASAGFGVLSKAASALRNLAVGGEVVSFQDFDVMGAIAESGLSNFIPAPEQSKIYSDALLGKYGGALQIGTPDMPRITTPSSAATITSISGTAIKDSNNNTIGYEPITNVTGTNLFVGAVFKTNLKVVDPNGVESNQDYYAIVTEVSSTTAGKIMPLRVTLPGKACNNPNAVIASAGSITFSYQLDTSSTYYIGQVRTKECFAYDNYKFKTLPGADDEIVDTVKGRSVKMTLYGQGLSVNKLIRCDSCYAAGLFEPRHSVTCYIKQA